MCRRTMHRMFPVDWDSVCGRCNVSVERGSYCGGCRAVRYCSSDCQTADWGRHREVCSDMSELRRQVYRRELPPSMLMRQPEVYSDDTSGLLTFLFPGLHGDGIFGFTRRTATVETTRMFVSWGMYLWSRGRWDAFVRGDEGGALESVWKLLFVRYGMVRTASHSAGERGGVPVICCRPLAVNVSFARHRRICVRLGELGLGLITGHPIGCRSGPVKWQFHDWRVLVEKDAPPRAWRHDVVFAGAAPLLPLSKAVFERHVSSLCTSVGDDLDADGMQSDLCVSGD